MDNSELEKALDAQATLMAQGNGDANTSTPAAEPTTPAAEPTPVIEDYTEKYKQVQAEKEELAAKLAQLESASKEPVFTSDFHKKAYEYAIAHPEMETDEAFREYAEITTLNVDKLDDIALLERAFEVANKNSGLSKDEIKMLFRRDYRNRFEFDAEEDDEDEVKFKQIQRKAEVVKAKALLSEEKTKYTPKKIEPQFTPQQLEEARTQRETRAKSYATTLAEKPLTFAIDNHSFNFKPDSDAIADSVLAVKNIASYLNETYGVVGSDGKQAWDFQALQRDIAMINSIDKLVKESFENGVNIGKQDILKQANAVTPNTPTAASGGTVSQSDVQKAFSKQIAEQIYK